MPHPSRRKGNRRERELVELHRALGIGCCRVPLSGSAGGDFAGDLRLALAGAALRAEVKARGSGAGFKTLERWLAGHDLLFLRRDRAGPMVLLPWGTWERLLRALTVAERPNGPEGNPVTPDAAEGR